MTSTIANQIEQIFNKTLDDYNMQIHKKYNIDLDELNSLLKSISLDDKTEKPAKLSRKSESFVFDKTLKPSRKSEVSSSTSKCMYLFKRGQKSGEICGVATKNGAQHCSKHTTKDEDATATTTTTKKKTQRMSEIPKTICLHKNKVLDMYVYDDTGFIVESPEKANIVIGKCVNDTFEKITSQEDIDKLNERGLLYVEILDFEEDEKKPTKISRKGSKFVDDSEDEKKSVKKSLEKEKTNLPMSFSSVKKFKPTVAEEEKKVISKMEKTEKSFINKVIEKSNEDDEIEEEDVEEEILENYESDCE